MDAKQGDVRWVRPTRALLTRPKHAALLEARLIALGHHPPLPKRKTGDGECVRAFVLVALHERLGLTVEVGHVLVPDKIAE